MLPPKLILCPIDFSDHSDEALKTSTELAACFGAKVCLVHVVPAIPKLPSVATAFHEGEYEQELRKNAKERLEEYVRKIGERGITARYEVGTANDVSMELLRVVEHVNADLIVISTHGMTGWHKLVFGSVTEKVVRLAECPVLVLRSQLAPESVEPKRTAPVAYSL